MRFVNAAKIKRGQEIRKVAQVFASFAVLGELCANVSLFLTTHSFRAKFAKDREARKDSLAD